MKNLLSSDRFARIVFGGAVASFIFAYGFAAGRYQLFPFQFVNHAAKGFREVWNESTGKLPWYYKRVAHAEPTRTRNSDDAYQGLNLVAKVARDDQLCVEIMDMDGRKLHAWNVDWFEIWPDAQHVPERWDPKSKPGTHVHGCALMENGDLVFSYEACGLVRLDRRGKVVWRLPRQTHHSVRRHDDGNLWVCSLRYHADPNSQFPNRVAPFVEYTLLEVTPDGRIAEEWSVADLLKENGLAGLLYLGSVNDRSTQIPVPGDALHLNNVEPFPGTMEEGFFKHGDILVSLRNINTVFVFNRQNRKIKFISTGQFIRQHDPDFIDGNRFSVFDNNNVAPAGHGQQSRIVIVSAPEKSLEVYFEGNSRIPFYTDILGKHQWLPNGNLLITESTKGRAFEINHRGELVWEYVNYVDRGVVGIVEEVQRIPLEYGRFFDMRSQGESQAHQPGREAR
jgi:hypothetical protein